MPLGKHLEQLVQKVFKRQRNRAIQDANLINKSSRKITDSFGSLPLEKQKELLQNEAVRNIVNFGKGEEARRDAHY